jgi:NAD-dependent dihydropyrimidine dehydrogenase PreA subunit
MYASRNISLCTKDCLCLFVCPTGATDTETGQIDREKCLDGCRLCVDACPSHAIYLVMENYPKPKTKDPLVIETLEDLLESKASQASLAAGLIGGESSRLFKALEESFRILGEDCARESRFMLPQSEAVAGLPEDQIPL